MSSEAESDVCCANCGVAEIDEIKLEECDLVKYCGDKCREDHREKHEEDCKTRAAILHDNKLFSKPDGCHRGECPLCFLPLPLDPQKSTFMSCCSKTICDGCDYAHDMSNGGDRCPFCREPAPDDEEWEKKMMKRIKAGDPAAIREMGTERYYEGDWDTAVKYWTKAAELGDAEAHYQLVGMYWMGLDGVEKDEGNAVYHLEQAAIGGHPEARHNLGCREHENGNSERAVKHFIIAANLGCELSMKELWKHYSAGAITKVDLDTTLRTHQTAINEMKSEDRDLAEKIEK
jgi:hypothetical protein